MYPYATHVQTYHKPCHLLLNTFALGCCIVAFDLIWRWVMAVVCKQGEWYSVAVDDTLLGQFRYLLDAHCFALQLMERGMAQSVRLYSGITVS